MKANFQSWPNEKEVSWINVRTETAESWEGHFFLCSCAGLCGQVVEWIIKKVWINIVRSSMTWRLEAISKFTQRFQGNWEMICTLFLFKHGTVNFSWAADCHFKPRSHLDQQMGVPSAITRMWTLTGFPPVWWPGWMVALLNWKPDCSFQVSDS